MARGATHNPIAGWVSTYQHQVGVHSTWRNMEQFRSRTDQTEGLLEAVGVHFLAGI